MEASFGESEVYGAPSTSNSSNLRRNNLLSASNIIRAPISTLLEYSGFIRPRSNHQEVEPLFNGGSPSNRVEDSALTNNEGEVSIRIIGASENHEDASSENEVLARAMEGSQGEDRTVEEGFPESSESENVDGNGRETYQIHGIQQAARCIEQVLPFSLLLLIIFIRQHLLGFFVTIWIVAVFLKSNYILVKQTALKGERKIPVLVGISIAFTLHVGGVYWLYLKDDILYPLVMLPPKAIPPFWHAIFTIMVNDTLVRQAAMIIKCFLLMYYKKSRGRSYRKQGKWLTFVEYLLLLYRALLPTPVWYRFFLNKEYGSLFSSLVTGLYLTFKLTSLVEKVQFFFTALRALSQKDIHYGTQATSEQVNVCGDLCAICQEKMQVPISLRCKHIFCEECVSEWFERERTCPLCRALVKPADLRSFGDGSTSLFFQLF